MAGHSKCGYTVQAVEKWDGLGLVNVMCDITPDHVACADVDAYPTVLKNTGGAYSVVHRGFADAEVLRKKIGQ